MPRPVILIADSATGAALPIAQGLLTRGCGVDVCSAGVSAIGALSARHAAGTPPRLVLASPALPDLDAAAFLRQVAPYGLPVVFYADLKQLPRMLLDAIQMNGGHVVGMPFDQARLDAVVAAALTGSCEGLDGLSGGGADDAKVLHGTAQFANMSTYLRTPHPGGHPDDAHGAGSSAGRRSLRTPLPGTEVSGQQSLADRRAQRTPLPPVAPELSGSSGTRSAVQLPAAPVMTPLPVPPAAVPPIPPIPPIPPPPPAPAPAAGASSAARRSISGRTDQVAGAQRAIRQIVCQGCGKVFVAEFRAAPYSLPCMHCGRPAVIG